MTNYQAIYSMKGKTAITIHTLITIVNLMLVQIHNLKCDTHTNMDTLNILKSKGSFL